MALIIKRCRHLNDGLASHGWVGIAWVGITETHGRQLDRSDKLGSTVNKMDTNLADISSNGADKAVCILTSI